MRVYATRRGDTCSEVRTLPYWTVPGHTHYDKHSIDIRLALSWVMHMKHAWQRRIRSQPYSQTFRFPRGFVVTTGGSGCPCSAYFTHLDAPPSQRKLALKAVLTILPTNDVTLRAGFAPFAVRAEAHAAPPTWLDVTRGAAATARRATLLAVQQSQRR